MLPKPAYAYVTRTTILIDSPYAVGAQSNEQLYYLTRTNFANTPCHIFQQVLR